MSFANELKATVEAVEASADSEQARRFRNVLDETVEGLEQLGVGARIDIETDPRKSTLYIYPLYRPQRGSRMVRFFIDDAELVVSGETSTQVKTPEELKSWFLKYVKSPAFIASLRDLRDLATVSVEARLRVSKQMNYHKDDVMVEVSKDDQEKLGKARPGEVVSLRVKRIDFPGNGVLRGEGYEVLNSAGIFVDVLKPNLIDGETIEIIGKRSE
jgi:hypothetical protein